MHLFWLIYGTNWSIAIEQSWKFQNSNSTWMHMALACSLKLACAGRTLENGTNWIEAMISIMHVFVRKGSMLPDVSLHKRWPKWVHAWRESCQHKFHLSIAFNFNWLFLGALIFGHSQFKSLYLGAPMYVCQNMDFSLDALIFSQFMVFYIMALVLAMGNEVQIIITLTL